MHWPEQQSSATVHPPPHPTQPPTGATATGNSNPCVGTDKGGRGVGLDVMGAEVTGAEVGGGTRATHDDGADLLSSQIPLVMK